MTSTACCQGFLPLPLAVVSLRCNYGVQPLSWLGKIRGRWLPLSQTTLALSLCSVPLLRRALLTIAEIASLVALTGRNVRPLAATTPNLPCSQFPLCVANAVDATCHC